MEKRVQDVVNSVAKRFVMPETTLLVALCTWDMLYTLYCVRTGLAREANPALRSSLAHSNSAFLVLKGATFLVPVVALELIRSKRPKFVSLAMRVGFVAYAVILHLGKYCPDGHDLVA